MTQSDVRHAYCTVLGHWYVVCPWDRHSTQENEPNPYLGRGTLGDWAGLLSFGGGGSLAVCVCVCWYNYSGGPAIDGHIYVILMFGGARVFWRRA